MTTTIITWRSSLTLLDIFVFPNDWLLSNVTCFVIGVAGSILLFAVETPLSQLANYIHRTRSHWLRLVYEDAIYLVVFATESFLWRGGWNLNAMFIISDPLVGGWVNHAIGTLLLISLQLLSYAAGCGCARDGQDADSADAVYATKYLRAFEECLRERNEAARHSPTQKRRDDVEGEDEDEENIETEPSMAKQKKSLVISGDALQLTALCSDSAFPMSAIVDPNQSSTRIL